jgi:hypothetical protein
MDWLVSVVVRTTCAQEAMGGTVIPATEEGIALAPRPTPSQVMPTDACSQQGVRITAENVPIGVFCHTRRRDDS